MEPSVQKLYDYIYERGTIVPVEDYSMELLSQGDISKRVTESIRCVASCHCCIHKSVPLGRQACSQAVAPHLLSSVTRHSKGSCYTHLA